MGKRFILPRLIYGYLNITRKWNHGDRIVMDMNMLGELVAADPLVKQNIGKRAIQRGPLVYCAEQVDDETDLYEITISTKNDFRISMGKGNFRTPDLTNKNQIVIKFGS